MSTEPLLDADDIQGNVLAGFNKDTQILVGLSIVDVAATKTWLRAIASLISSTAEVLQFNRLFRKLRRRRGGMEPSGLVATWFNIAFSHDGLRKLTSQDEADAVPDAGFRKGMAARSSYIGDPSDPASPFHVSKWIVGGPNAIPDVFLIIASDDDSHAADFVARLFSAPGFGGLEPIYRETGRTRTDQRGHEHFGFKDGISQPGVRGMVSSAPGDFLAPRAIDPEDPRAADFARPGQPLVMPGQFVLGYDAQRPKDGKVVPAPALQFSWLRNGSFLVFRRLRQDVEAFRSFVAAAEAMLKPLLPSVTAAGIAAAFVGRWPDGAPLIRAPNGPDPAMAGPIASNAFAFDNPMPALKLKPGAHADATPPSPADPLGLVCPHWAHIRKVNPRDGVTNLGDEFDTMTRRMLRRGIPYGASLQAGAADDGVDRGLLFLAYHASIEASFEQVTKDWVNQRQNPQPDGNDPVIGQSSEPGRTRKVMFETGTGLAVPLPIDREWVFPTGGGYFFAPSISAVMTRLS